MRARSAWAVTLGAVTFIVAVSAGGQAGSPAAAPDTADLRQQIAALEKRVAILEERLCQQPAIGALPVPPTSLQIQPLPKGWQQRQFNGMPYYLAPAEAGQTGSGQPGH